MDYLDMAYSLFMKLEDLVSYELSRHKVTRRRRYEDDDYYYGFPAKKRKRETTEKKEEEKTRLVCWDGNWFVFYFNGAYLEGFVEFYDGGWLRLPLPLTRAHLDKVSYLHFLLAFLLLLFMLLLVVVVCCSFLLCCCCFCLFFVVCSLFQVCCSFCSLLLFLLFVLLSVVCCLFCSLLWCCFWFFSDFFFLKDWEGDSKTFG